MIVSDRFDLIELADITTLNLNKSDYRFSVLALFFVLFLFFHCECLRAFDREEKKAPFIEKKKNKLRLVLSF